MNILGRKANSVQISYANSTRGNNPFAEVINGEQPAPDCGASQIGFSQNSPTRGAFFEPPHEHKGNVARALFYFSVRYKMPIDSQQEAFLKQWHKNDPVNNQDRERNEAIFAEQKNRNPFVDFPELVEQIADF